MCYMQKLVLSIPKVYFKPTFFPIYSLQVPDIYLNYGDFTWRVSDCEELVGGLVTRNNGVKFIVGIAAYSIADCIS